MPSDSQSPSSSSARCTSCGEVLASGHACKNPFQNLIGQSIDGRYQVKSILGQGGMGVVFQATQTSMNRDIALKMLHPTLSTTPQFSERFRREAEVVSRLKHPNIISIFDFGQAPSGAFYYTMELLEGENLKALVKRDGPMTVARALNLIDQVGEALAYAHSQNILHRDMKPHNVMCARFHGRDHVKVLDFGLVKMVDEEGGDEDHHLTTTGQILGTPAYMSPEQAGGDPLDARSDLYSLGVVLYYLLAGSTPFKANSANKLLQQAMTQEVPLVGTRRQGAPIPGELDMFLRRALAFDKDGRPADVEAFLEEMHASVDGVAQAVLDAVPTGATQPAVESPTKTSNQRKSGVRSSVSMVAPAPAPPSTSRALVIGAGVGLVVLLGLGGAVLALRKPAVQPVAVVVAPPKPIEPAKPELPANVSVNIETDPPGAQLFEGTKQVGVAPANLLFQRSRGAVNLIVKLAGYAPRSEGIDLAGAGAAPVNLIVKLTPDPAAQKPEEKPHAKPVGKRSSGKVDVPIFE